MFAIMVLSALVGVGDGTSDWIAALVVGVLFFGLPGFLLAFWRQARLVPWWGVTGIGLGVLVIYLGYAAWQSDLSFEENAAQVLAVMSGDAEEQCNSTQEGITSSCWWTGPFSYEVDGVEYSGVGTTPSGAVTGDEFLILYSTENPSEWRVINFEATTVGGLDVPSGDWGYWVLPVVGLALIAAGVVGFRYQIREQHRQREAATASPRKVP